MKETKKLIEERINQGQPRPKEPKKLKLYEIELITEVFQSRSCKDSERAKHIDVLEKSLRHSKGQPLEPLTVYWIGDAWALVDGHHRYAAYEINGYAKAVPVKVFEGGLDEAIGESFRGNSRDKLKMSKREKMDAAWRIVLCTDLSITQTTAVSTISHETVCKMRGAKTFLLEKYSESELIAFGWGASRKMFEKDTQPEKRYDESWEEAEARKLAARLAITFGTRWEIQPEIFWKAVEIFDPRLTEYILDDGDDDKAVMEMMKKPDF